ncbi:MAG: hypothetical protein LUG12_11730 [Erysipelotrichaceae bacterium]|nr:hypothetical protein [Erysipelotrichaceae bacterium]
MQENVMYYAEIDRFKKVHYPWNDFSFVDALSESECCMMCSLIKEGKSLYEIKETLFNGLGGSRNGNSA